MAPFYTLGIVLAVVGVVMLAGWVRSFSFSGPAASPPAPARRQSSSKRRPGGTRSRGRRAGSLGRSRPGVPTSRTPGLKGDRSGHDRNSATALRQAGQRSKQSSWRTWPFSSSSTMRARSPDVWLVHRGSQRRICFLTAWGPFACRRDHVAGAHQGPATGDVLSPWASRRAPQGSTGLHLVELVGSTNRRTSERIQELLALAGWHPPQDREPILGRPRDPGGPPAGPRGRRGCPPFGTSSVYPEGFTAGEASIPRRRKTATGR